MFSQKGFRSVCIQARSSPVSPGPGRRAPSRLETMAAIEPAFHELDKVEIGRRHPTTRNEKQWRRRLEAKPDAGRREGKQSGGRHRSTVSSGMGSSERS